jgi:predicted metal-dependent hydrolase
MTRRSLEPSAPRLFSRGELSLQRTGLARIRDAVRPLRNPTLRELQGEQDEQAMKRLRAMADDLAPRFKLRYRMIEAEREGVTEHYGICYEDGEIRIRLRHARSGRLLKESSLVDTLCHELAHLRHLDHSVRFRRLYWRILNKARDLGYYKPGPSEARPQQLGLFEDGACGTKPYER